MCSSISNLSRGYACPAAGDWAISAHLFKQYHNFCYDWRFPSGSWLSDARRGNGANWYSHFAELTCLQDPLWRRFGNTLQWFNRLQDTTTNFVWQILNTPCVELDVCDEFYEFRMCRVYDLRIPPWKIWRREGQRWRRWWRKKWRLKEEKLSFRRLLALFVLHLLSQVNVCELSVQLVLVENIMSKWS